MHSAQIPAYDWTGFAPETFVMYSSCIGHDQGCGLTALYLIWIIYKSKLFDTLVFVWNVSASEEQEDESRNVVNKKALTILKYSHRGGTINCTNGSAYFFTETFRRSLSWFAFDYDKTKLTSDSIKTAGISMPSPPPTCSDTGVRGVVCWCKLSLQWSSNRCGGLGLSFHVINHPLIQFISLWAS